MKVYYQNYIKWNTNLLVMQCIKSRNCGRFRPRGRSLCISSVKVSIAGWQARIHGAILSWPVGIKNKNKNKKKNKWWVMIYNISEIFLNMV